MLLSTLLTWWKQGTWKVPWEWSHAYCSNTGTLPLHSVQHDGGTVKEHLIVKHLSPAIQLFWKLAINQSHTQWCSMPLMEPLYYQWRCWQQSLLNLHVQTGLLRMEKDVFFIWHCLKRPMQCNHPIDQADLYRVHWPWRPDVPACQPLDCTG